MLRYCAEQAKRGVTVTGMATFEDEGDLAALIIATAAGSRAAFDRLYARTRRRVYGLLLAMLRNVDDATEVLQEVYLRLWRKAHHFERNGSAPMSWVLALARNAAIDRIRAQKRFSTQDTYEDIHAQDGGLVHEDRIAMSHCLAGLAPDRAVLVRKVYLLGLSYEEVCAEIGVPLNTVKSWLRRSLLALKSCMTGEA
jgi:RNA polymerase sigma-70 factor (ECF subfamily)